MAFNEVKDSGVREEMPTGSRRDTREGKGRYDLLPTFGIHRIARHFENGSKKYGDRNWELGQPLSRMLDSGIRHAFEYLQGRADEDHLAAAVWNLLCALDTEERIRRGLLPAGLDDLPGNPTGVDTSKEGSNLRELRTRLRDSKFCTDPEALKNLNPAWLAVCPAYDHSHDLQFISNPAAFTPVKMPNTPPPQALCECDLCQARRERECNKVPDCRQFDPNFVEPPEETAPSGHTPPPASCDCQIYEECSVCRPLSVPAPVCGDLRISK